MQQKSELPEGWAWAKIGGLAFVTKLAGFEFTKYVKYKEFGEIPVIKAQNVTKNGFSEGNFVYVDRETMENLPRSRLYGGEVLLVFVGSLGNVGIVPEGTEFFLGPNVAKIKIDEKVSDRKFIKYYIQSELGRSFIFDFSKSTTQSSISMKNIRDISVPLPPLPEQHRIVSAVEALFARLDATNEKLGRVLEILKNFRESVLASAFNGRLTEDWRVVFQNSKVQSESFEKHINVNSIYFSENPMTTNNEVFPALPNKWCWATIEQLASNEPRSIQSGPFGSNLLHSEFQETGILAIGIDNVLYRSFSLGKEHRISNEKYQELKKYTARPLDVLITVMATVGRCCVVPQDVETAIITKHVYRITPNREVISPHYLMNALSGAAIVKEQIDNQIRGQTRPGINGKILKETSIPLPPLPEQQEIVRRVDSLFAFADSIEAKVAAAREKTEKLRQSTLAKAFSGQLVETEAEIARREGREYETAEVFLKKLKEERRKSGKKDKSNNVIKR